jgi:hypothetical protein
MFRRGARRVALHSLAPAQPAAPPGGRDEVLIDAETGNHPGQGGTAGTGQATRQCQPSLPGDGLLTRQLPTLQRTPRQGRRGCPARDVPAQAVPEEPDRSAVEEAVVAMALEHPVPQHPVFSRQTRCAEW